MKDVKFKLNPNWVTGFVDAEGCFYVQIDKRKNSKSAWKTQPCFQIKLHIKDKDLLLQIKSFFNEVGLISTNYNYNFVVYKVHSLSDITNIIIPHFEKYPLISQKYGDFIIFQNIIKLMNKKEHLNKKGLINIVSLKASLNKGLSHNLKICFPNINKIIKSKANIPINIDYNWIAGFFSGDGCCSIGIYKSNTHKIGYGIILQIIFTQHLKDEVLLNSIKKVLGCGNIIKYPTKNIIVLSISKFKDTYYKMIPLFNKYEIKGIKLIDFQDFSKAAELINKKYHLTKEGLENIRKIKNNMNRNRIHIILYSVD